MKESSYFKKPVVEEGYWCSLKVRESHCVGL